MSVVDLLSPGFDTSEPFEIPARDALVLHAYNLQSGESVIIERIGVSRGGAPGTVCCPGPVALPEVQSAHALTDCGGAVVELTPAVPWATLRDPRGASLRVRLLSPDVSLSQVVVTSATVSRDGEEEVSPSACPVVVTAAVQLCDGSTQVFKSDGTEETLPACVVPPPPPPPPTPPVVVTAAVQLCDGSTQVFKSDGTADTLPACPTPPVVVRYVTATAVLPNGSVTAFYNDGTSEVVGAPLPPHVVYHLPLCDGDIEVFWSDGTSTIRPACPSCGTLTLGPQFNDLAGARIYTLVACPPSLRATYDANGFSVQNNIDGSFLTLVRDTQGSECGIDFTEPFYDYAGTLVGYLPY